MDDFHLSAQCHLLDRLLRPSDTTTKEERSTSTVPRNALMRDLTSRRTHESDWPSEDDVSRDGLTELQRVAWPEANSNFHNGDDSAFNPWHAAQQVPMASRTAK
jgi:hypothetical protein